MEKEHFFPTIFLVEPNKAIMIEEKLGRSKALIIIIKKQNWAEARNISIWRLGYLAKHRISITQLLKTENIMERYK